VRTLPLLLLLASAGCTTYEYEEEIFLEVDGSGRIRMSGSTAAVEALHGIRAEMAKSLFEGIVVHSVRETERGGQMLVHVEASFTRWENLCQVPAFRGRACRFTRADTDRELELSIPSAPAAALVDRAAPVAFRFHFPSAVRHHNSPNGIERGNIVSWKRAFDGPPLDIRVRFDRRTLLAERISVMGKALFLVVASIGTALLWMRRKGRRELSAEATSGCPSRSGRLAGE
jgi:hypothetical protein